MLVALRACAACVLTRLLWCAAVCVCCVMLSSASFLTILSYNGGVVMGCLIDSRVIADTHEVLDLFVSELHALQATVDALQKQGKLKATLKLRDQDRAI